MNSLQSFYSCLASLNFRAIFWVLIFFGGSIFVHELGHFLAARRRKLFVPRFSIGFGPRIFSKTIGETEFCLSLFPLGGYVALPQLMEAKAIEGKYTIPRDTPPISWVDKIIVSAMGVIFNILFALILGTILWITGIQQPQSSMNNIIGYVHPEITLPDGTKVSGPAKEAGLKIGDQIVAIDGLATHCLIDIIHGVALGRNRDSLGPLSTVTILRNGQRRDFTIHPVLVEQNQRSKEALRVIGIETFQELFIADIYQNTPAERVGLQKNDKIVAINDERIFSYSQFNDLLTEQNTFQLTVERNGQNITVSIQRETLPTTYPFLKITTPYGTFEALPVYGDKNSLKDPHKDTCTLQLLAMEPGLQTQFPQWQIDDSITHIQDWAVDNIGDSFARFQDFVGAPIAVTLRGEKFSFPVEKAELIPPNRYPSIGIELRGTHVLVHQNPFYQIWESARITLQTLRSLLSPTSDIHLKNLSGPPGILDALHTFAAHDLRLLLWLVIMLNVNLVIINLLPLPVLDGGLIALILLEVIFHRKMATQLLAGLQLVFMALFLGLTIYISFFDIHKILERRDSKRDYHRQRQLIIDEQVLWNGLKGE
jgi:membrane-associated protease RseP (regulator of RpoE activity)